VTPPTGHTAQADQTSGLGWDAVCGYELLLLAQRVEEAERVRPESDHGHDRKQCRRPARARRDACALAPRRRGEHDEREHEPG